MYQGDNRFSLRDIEFYQHKFNCPNRESGLFGLTAPVKMRGTVMTRMRRRLRCKSETRSDYSYSKVYYRYWVDSIAPMIEAHGPQGFWTLRVISHVYHSPRQHLALVSNNQTNLTDWHRLGCRTGPTMATLA